jgi:hypothetical protein
LFVFWTGKGVKASVPGCYVRLQLSSFFFQLALIFDFSVCRMGIVCKQSVSGCHVRWLYMHAFVRALGRKQTRYPQLLPALRQEMSGPQYSLLPAQLAGVVLPSRSPAFDIIQY